MKRAFTLILTLCMLAGMLLCPAEEIDYRAEYERLLQENEALRAEISRLQALLGGEDGDAAVASNVIASFDGGEVTFEEVYASYEEAMGYYEEMLASYGMEPDFAPEEILQMQIDLARELADAKIINAYLEENGIELLSKEETDALTSLAESEYSQMFESAVSDVVGMGYDRQGAEEYVTDYFSEFDMELETVIDEHLSQAREAALTRLLAGEVTVSEEELAQAYSALLTSDREYYSQYPEDYAFDALYSESPIAYVPEGYRQVRMLIVPFDEESMSAYDEHYYGGTTDSQEADALFAALLPEAEEVYRRLLNGESFDAIRAEYPDTELYMDQLGGAQGFCLSSESEMFGYETDGAIMALENIGDVTKPQKCDWGWAIFEYAGDVAPGEVPLEKIKGELYLQTYNDKQTAQYEAGLEKLRADANLTFYFERLN